LTAVITGSAQETLELGVELAKELPSRAVVCLYGDLGAGKTTLIKGLAAGICGCPVEEITSPTFLIMHLYEGAGTVAHFDLYRLSSSESLVALGGDELFGVADLCCIEWPERIEGLYIPNRWNIWIEQLDQETRRISYGAAT
jgi:tRNA threonylcarbamoyladenosine biosynthesis protein TsaE